jgi:type I restriction enzyme S subunit
MKVIAGFKRTDAGVIPSDWNIQNLAEVSIIERGKFSARPRNDPKYYGGDIPFIQTGDVARSKGKIQTFTQSLNSSGLRVSRLFPSGTLFFTIAANIGDVAIADFSAACPDSLVAIRPKSNTHKVWLKYELTSRKKDFEQLASPGAQLNINLEKLKPYLLPHPPLEEQVAIATVLSDVDALLDSIDLLIAKKYQLKQGAMQQLLTGQTRLPGFSGEWELKRFGDLGSTYGGLTGKKKADFGNGDARYITFMNVMQNVVIDCESFERVEVSQQEAQNRVRKGDLFFNGSSETPEEVALCSVLLDEVQSVYLNSFCFGFRFREDMAANGIFFAYYLRGPVGRKLMKSLAQGSTRYNLSKVALLNTSLLLPTPPEQTAIAEVLTGIDAELAALEQRRKKTAAFKQGMMQELLTGRIRLV